MLFKMKNFLIVIVVLGITINVFAQGEQTQKGSVVIEANTNVGSIGGILGGNGTGFLLSTSDGTTIWNIGGELGYFTAENFAIKVGFGYGDFDGFTLVSYKIGGKYYVEGKIPFQVDYTGQSGDDFFSGENPSYLGLQGGYAFFLGEMVSIEPSLRYNLSLNSDFFDDIFQIQIGFSIFL